MTRSQSIVEEKATKAIQTNAKLLYSPFSKLIWAILILLMLGYVAFFSVQLILHYYSFGSRSLDLGNMNQAIWNTSQGRWFHQTNQPGAFNRLSLHVEPIFIPISLLYYIYSGPEILFIFQSIIVALGAIPVFLLARLRLKSELLGLVFAVIYLTFPAIQGATLLDFHGVTLAPTFLLAAFYALEIRRTGWFALFAVLAVSCKEDMTLLVLMIGVYAFIINRQYRLGAITVALCFLWAYLAVFVIPPTFASTENIHWDRYGHLGESPIDIVLNMVRRPDLFISHLQAVDAIGYFRQLLSPTLFAALLNPITLFLALPSFGINLLSSFPPMQRVNSLIYAAPTVPAVMISSIYGIANLKAFLIYLWARFRQQERISPTLQLGLNGVFSVILIIAALFYHLDYGYLPGGGQFRGWEEVTDHHRRAQRIFDQIPPDAALSAHDRLNPHVSQRETLYIFNRIEDADHIVLDITEDSWPLHPVELRFQVDQFLEGDFGIVDAYDGYLLLAKDQPDLPRKLPDEFYDFARVSNPETFTPAYPTNIVFGNKLKLLGYDLVLGAHEANLPVAVLYWQALAPLEENYRLWPFFINRNGQLIEDTSERPLVSTLWYPTTAWSPDEIIITQTLPRDLGEEFTLAVGVTTDRWADPAQRLPITTADEGLYRFEQNTWVRLNTFERAGRRVFQTVTQQPAPLTPYEARFGDAIDLNGVAVPSEAVTPGESVALNLSWQTQAPIPLDLTTFAHLRDAQGNTVAQLDWTPQDGLGFLPTSAWQPDRAVIDNQQLPLPETIPSGTYQLVVGWYYAVTGDRVPLTSGEGDVAFVGEVTVR